MEYLYNLVFFSFVASVLQGHPEKARQILYLLGMALQLHRPYKETLLTYVER